MQGLRDIAAQDVCQESEEEMKRRSQIEDRIRRWKALNLVAAFDDSQEFIKSHRRTAIAELEWVLNNP